MLIKVGQPKKRNAEEMRPYLNLPNGQIEKGVAFSDFDD